MTEQELVITERQTVELLAFLTASARGLISEPKDYGPMRLLEAAKRLCLLVLPQARGQSRQFVTGLVESIDQTQSERRADPEKYAALMDECCRVVARELLRQEEGGRRGDE